VGMMGAGKSAVGQVLARELGRPFVDTDERIESEAGCSVAEVFEREGEAGFRRREADVIRRVAEQAARAGAVVALGGGAIAQPSAPERLARSGLVVYLRARPERLAARIAGVDGGASRPLLAGLTAEGRLERLRALLAEREPAYRTASLVVDTEGDDVVGLARRLMDAIEAHEARGGRANDDGGESDDSEVGRS